MTFLNWLSSTIGTTALLAIVAFLARQWILARLAGAIKNEYDKNLATHVDSLRQRTELVLKEFEAKMSERNIKLTSIFERQAEAILTIYKSLYALRESVNGFMQSRIEKDETKRRQANGDLAEKFTELSRFYQENKVLIHYETAEKLDRLRKLYAELFVGHIALGSKTERRFTDEEIAERLERRRELDQMETAIDEVSISLEADFKKILGIQVSDVAGTKKPGATLGARD